MKNVRDSVHGNIVVEDRFVKTILDTPAFQRLRRVEQTSIRSIFPSARHDRFIHSLGVYYIGNLFVKHLWKEFDAEILRKDGNGTFFGIPKEELILITNSYLVACLLHDVAHAPFSHTFEDYYGTQDNLFNRLNDDLSKTLDKDTHAKDDPKPHEYASAILACEQYGPVIEGELKASKELVSRMIIGWRYSEKQKYAIHNCFISLLHGDVVDADRMDYACRDVWASGYCTSSIDVERIVAATHILLEPQTDILRVCFDCNAINEIQNMLEVRQFQNRYVINHHSVQYEQKLMVKAAEYAALKNEPEGSNIIKGEDALQKFITIDNCISRYLSDEDLLSFMKGNGTNPYYNEFTSRQYKRFAVWKTPDEFFHFFPNVPRGMDLKHDDLKSAVREVLGIELGIKDAIFCKVKYKMPIRLDDLFIVVNGDVVLYTDIHPELKIELGNVQKDINFYYLYVEYPDNKEVILNDYRKKIVDLLTPVFNVLYPQSNNEYHIYEFIQDALEKAFEEICAREEYERRKLQIVNMEKNIKDLRTFMDKSGILSLLENY